MIKNIFKKNKYIYFFFRRYLFPYFVKQEKEILFLRDFEFKTSVDIGANVGTYTVELQNKSKKVIWKKNGNIIILDYSYSVNDNAGVYLIPAFSGLGAPHWQMSRKASIEGMTFGTSKNHIVRAALESIPYQIKDVIAAMQKDINGELKSISVNGGLTRNSFVISFLCDLLALPLQKQSNSDVSALGAAYLAGLKSGIFESIEQLKKLNIEKTEIISPNKHNNIVERGYKGWLKIIEK
jgi:glycerol kinase